MAALLTPEDVAALLPAAPPVTPDQLQDAQDWAEEQFDLAGVPYPTTDGRALRNYRRAVAWYAVARVVGPQVLAQALDTERVQKLKEGAKEMTFAVVDGEAASVAAFDQVAEAWRYLVLAGLPRPVDVAAFAGVAL